MFVFLFVPELDGLNFQVHKEAAQVRAHGNSQLPFYKFKNMNRTTENSSDINDEPKVLSPKTRFSTYQ
jgi:hypothetical protein